VACRPNTGDVGEGGGWRLLKPKGGWSSEGQGRSVCTISPGNQAAVHTAPFQKVRKSVGTENANEDTWGGLRTWKWHFHGRESMPGISDGFGLQFSKGPSSKLA
jgi:hypothetical protein